MRYIHLNLFSLFFLSTTALFAQSVSMKFQIAAFEEDTIYIGNHYGKEKYLLDTITVTNGEFFFEIDNPKVGIYFLYTPSYYLEFVVDGDPFYIQTDLKNPYENMEIEGSLENELFRTFQVQLGKLQRRQRDLIGELSGANSQDSTRIFGDLQVIANQVKNSREQIVRGDPDSFVSSFLSLMDEPEVPSMSTVEDDVKRNLLRYNYYKNHFLTDKMVRDTRLLRTPLIHDKVMRYFDKAVIQHPDSIIQEIDWYMGLLSGSEESSRYWLVTFFQKYAESKQMGMDAVMIHIIEDYYLAGKANWVSEDYIKKLKDEVAFVKPNLIGKVAPRIDAVDIQLNPFGLETISSEYTLLFIYDPDCGHCKQTLKKLEENEVKLESLGIEVVALCTTTDMERWKDFVETTNSHWKHCIDPTGQSYFRVSYNVRTTPKMFLLDENKRIVAKKLEVDQFIDFVERRNR